MTEEEIDILRQMVLSMQSLQKQVCALTEVTQSLARSLDGLQRSQAVVMARLGIRLATENETKSKKEREVN